MKTPKPNTIELQAKGSARTHPLVAICCLTIFPLLYLLGALVRAYLS